MPVSPLLLLVGLGGVGAVLRKMWVRWSRAHWVKTEATIIKEEPVQAFYRETGVYLAMGSQSTPKYEVTYIYEVDGEEIVSSSVRRPPGVRWYLGGVPINGTGGQTEGKGITVYYNPEVPVRSTTDIHVGIWLYLSLAISFIVLTIGVLMILDGML